MFQRVCLASFSLNLNCHFERLEPKCGPKTEGHLLQSRLFEHELDHCSSPADNGFVPGMNGAHNYTFMKRLLLCL